MVGCSKVEHVVALCDWGWTYGDWPNGLMMGAWGG